jgi:predicted O-linked N-acetylglucosamine transferase (SPINDLY family)
LRNSPPTSASASKMAKKKIKSQPGTQIKPNRISAGHQGSLPIPQEMNKLVSAFAGGRYTEAAALAQVITEHFPLYGVGWKALGTALNAIGRSADALAAIQKAAALSPTDAEAHYNLGTLLQDAERLAEAETSYRRALQIKPDYAGAYGNLGIVLHTLGRLEEAEASYRRAIEIKPDYAEAHYNLGITQKNKGRLDEAKSSYQRAIEIKPDYAEAHNNLGMTLYEKNQLKEAEACYRQAVQIKPDYAEAHNNLGTLLKDLGLLDEAQTSYYRALEIKPDYATPYCNLSAVLQDLGYLEQAVACYQRALEIKPDYEDAFSNMLFGLNYHPKKSGEEIFEVYREYDARFGLPHRSEWRAHNNDRDTQRRLKVGYVSPDFKQHSSRRFLEHLLAHHDKKVIEVYAYAELACEDTATTQYKALVDHWLNTTGMSDAALTECIRTDGIDILVDLAGHTAHNRLGVFARKPTPVSLSWLGCGYTTGLSAMDYYLTDEASAPPGSEALFSEYPWRLATPTPCYVYRPAEGMGEISPLPAMSSGHITFGTLTRMIRINHRVIRVWSEILKNVQGARLVIDSRDFRAKSTQDNLAEKFAVHGISRDRLQIGCHSPPWDTMRGIDIGLDCFPHNSGTTLFETLYMGLPYITLADRPSVGRIGSSILHGVGHPEWIAETEDEYVEKAVVLAKNLPSLATLRAGLRLAMQAGPLMDEITFARVVETAYREMWIRWCEKGT